MGKKSRRKRFKRERLYSDAAHYPTESTAGQTAIYLGIGLYLWAVFLTIDTIIGTKQILLAVLSGTFIGSIVFAIFWRNAKKSLFFILFIGLIVGGSVSTFTLLAANDYFKNPSVEKVLLPISKSGNDSGRRSSCKTPYAEIIYHEMEKEIKFPCEYEKTISNFSKVEISFRMGLFGFPVIMDKKLIN